MDVRLPARADPDRAARRDARGHPAQPRHHRRCDPALAWAVGAQRRGRSGRGHSERGISGRHVRLPLPSRAAGHLLVPHAPARPGGDCARTIRRAGGAARVQVDGRRRHRAAVPHHRDDCDPGRQRPGAARGGGSRHASPASAHQHRAAAAAIRADRGGVSGCGPGWGRSQRTDGGEQPGAAGSRRRTLRPRVPDARQPGATVGRGSPAGGPGPGREHGCAGARGIGAGDDVRPHDVRDAEAGAGDDQGVCRPRSCWTGYRAS
jgi:hypothetical protein